MFWFFIPVAIVALTVVVSVWIIAANANRAARLNERESLAAGEQQKKSPDAPPA